MIARDLASILAHWATIYPVVTLTGPRQSGKTTLCRATFPKKPYVSLEPMDVRAHAQEDPRGFLAQFSDGAVLDEVQRVPELFSYIQDRVDRAPKAGCFVLTGSQQMGLSEAISQSLAGRAAILHLLPPSYAELMRFPDAPRELFSLLHTGAYPRIHDQSIPADRWLADYVATYVQRDVRQLLNIGDLDTFMTFLRLCAGCSGQELNLSRLGVDAGISQPTAKAWLSVLEASFICFRLPAWHANLRKRLVKSPKLHFYDSGLLCHLLGIQIPEQLRSHPLRGAIFESWVASEILKQRHHLGKLPRVHHYREVSGLEVDLVVQDGLDILLVEVKSGQTVDGSFLDPLLEATDRLQGTHPECQWARALVYGGDEAQSRRRDGLALPGHHVGVKGGTSRPKGTGGPLFHGGDVRVLPWNMVEELTPGNATVTKA